MTLGNINEKFNYELWKQIKTYAFTIESCNLARMFYGTGIEVDCGIHEEEVTTEMYLGDEIDVKPIIDEFKPRNSNVKISEFFTLLSPKAGTNLYSLISDNLLVELVSIFETYLQGTVENLLTSNIQLVLTKDKQINASDLLNVTDIEDLKERLIDEKVRKIMYQKIKSIIKYLEKGFKVDFNFDEKQLKEIYYWKEVRNLIIHNRGVVNELFLQFLRKSNIESELQIGDKICLEISNVIGFAKVIRFVGNEIYTKITGEVHKELEIDPFKTNDTEIIESYYKKKPIQKDEKIGRNDLCYCGSNKKYKNCCLNKENTLPKK